MSDVIFVGNKAQNIYVGADVPKITRVNLVVDSDHMYTAGNDTGRTIEVECPWGTQVMASNILANISGVEYSPYTAERTLLDPAFEIGDAVRIGGVYSLIATADCNYNSASLVTIEAPDLDEIDDEYPAQQSQQNSIKRQLAYTRSLISKTSSEILLKVEGTDGKGGLTGQVSEIKTTLDNISLTATNGSTSSKLVLKSGDVELASAEIKLTGFVTFEGLSGGTTTIDGSCIKTGVISAERINVSEIKIGDLSDDVGLVTDENVTLITKNAIKTANISADQINTGTLDADYVKIGGLLEITYWDKGDWFDEATGYIGCQNTGAIVVTSSDGSTGLYASDFSAMLVYGNSEEVMGVGEDGCFASSPIGDFSDRTLKNSISYDLDTEEALFAKLRPCSYAYNSDKKSKKWWGFIAQDLQESAEEVGMDVDTLGVLGRYNDKMTISYGAITALNTHMIQKLIARVVELEAKNQ